MRTFRSSRRRLPLRILVTALLSPLQDGPLGQGARATARQRCAFGAGEAVPQPPHDGGDAASGGAANVSCTPPSVVGTGSVAVEDIDGLVDDHVYLDAQLFSYYPKPPPVGDGTVKVALLSMGGADGKSNLSTSLAYVAKAGTMGTDLCVLPENFAQKHIVGSDGLPHGDMSPPPQPVSGSIISAVAEVAKKYKMYVVAPIREKRGELILNTAVVIGRNGSVVARYSKLFPVLGPPVRLSLSLSLRSADDIALPVASHSSMNV
jgi:hypothetical protein